MSKLFYYIAILLLIASCAMEDPREVPILSGPVFPDSKLIEIPTYNYKDSETGKQYTVPRPHLPGAHP